jgi:hypothetical protein
MKNKSITLLQNNFLPTSQYLIMITALVLWTSCGTITSIKSPETITPTSKVHVAFSGGGWRAHTAHTGWTIPLLFNRGRKLKDAFVNVETISSNSGGSWFSTMLIFSKKFVADIESLRAINTWDSTGWLGLQKKHFNATYCHELRGDEFIACVTRHYTHHKSGHWDLVVKDLIFKDYSLNGATLGGVRQPWATNKSLLIAASMLTSQVVLNEEGLSGWYHKRYYQACISPSEPNMRGGIGSSCKGINTDVSPVTFSSLSRGSGFKSPPFLTEAGKNKQFNLGYTETKRCFD